ncbi:pectinesterase inhibitor-like [Zingiber officinale]|uniref:pectinesterase inhibitor-like n=1 Tax=Zingiber officinale TaxID=94328 RepID=UPI001C4D0368|nr:pectinesterase inhibitor-like [Zingiber officinale]
MARYTALSLLLFVLSAAPHHSSAAVSDSLKNACAKFVFPDFCLKALGDDPRSATADLRGLGLISLELSVASAKAISSDYAQQRRDPSHDASGKNWLDSCLLLYQHNLPPLLDYSHKFLESGSPEVGRGLLTQAGQVATVCDGGMKEGDKANLGSLIFLAQRFMELLSPQ